MKKFISILLICLFVLPLNVSAQEITVTINGEPLVTDTAPQIVNDRTMLPMRAIFEALGADVTWIDADKLIFATKNDCMIVLQIGTSEMSVQRTSDNTLTAITLDTAPYIYNDRTMVPVRAVAEALDARVDWDGDTKTVIIEQ